MATVLFRANTASGVVSLTADTVTIQHPGGWPSPKVDVILRSTIVSMSRRVTMPRTLGRFGGALEFRLHTNDGRQAVIKSVGYNDGLTLCDLLGLPRP